MLTYKQKAAIYDLDKDEIEHEYCMALEKVAAMYRRMQSLELTNVLCERDV